MLLLFLLLLTVRWSKLQSLSQTLASLPVSSCCQMYLLKAPWSLALM